jgi:PAS domain S-box-containing protein
MFPKTGVLSTAEDSRYVLEPLREGADFTLYRGKERDNPTPILAVAVAAEQPSPQSLQRLEHEYALATTLDAAWAARPLALTRHQGRTFLILGDPGGEPLDRLIEQHKERPIDLTRFLRIAIGLAVALGQAHRQGLIHKDVKPANALVDDSGHVWLTGFGIASQLPRERLAPAEIIAGTHAYMSPEQTGRMNRSIDSRTDLYSLGVTFYQMLTGSLPFSAQDPLEWVHCHIARTPVSPRQRLETTPAPISQLVMKLLAKTAEERYQTAAGVEHDLQHCRAEWERGGRVDDFPLAEHDLPDQLLIPERLYGRSREVAALLGSFDHVIATGVPELVLVSGYSGIGKSSVVNELYRVLVPPRGLFATGKCDQYKRDIPYATLAQAFQSLVRQVLSKSEAELQTWQEALRGALGANGLLIVDLIPELELVIGKQPPVHDLSPQDARRRFQAVLRRFIGVFARPEHPLALFLDDLPWLDAPTLDLLEDLFKQTDFGHFLLIGAYRDNEVDATHPLLLKLDAVRRTGATVQDVVLAPLSDGDLGQLIADSLHCESARAGPLTQLVLEKTGGNPFFAIQFLQALWEEGLLVFDHEGARWSWDIDRIHAKRYTDNVVDLMVSKLARLPAETQAALSQLACVGSGAVFALLGTLCEISPEDLHDSLWEAVRAGLVLRLEDSYAFQHDRIQEAAYSLIVEDARAKAHLRIGRLLLANTPANKREEVIFEIVSQFNRSSALITSQDERAQLAELNLIAGKRAQASSAYLTALSYLSTGTALSTKHSSNQCRELGFALELARAHCEFAAGMIAEAEQRLRGLSIRAATTAERAAVACLQVDLYQGIDRSDEAVAVGSRALRQLGVDLPERPTEADVRSAYDGIQTQLGARAIEDLVNLPLMSNPASLAAAELLIRVAVPASFFESPHLFSVAVCAAVSLGLEQGHSDASCIAYAQLGHLATYLDQFDAGYRFGRLGCELAERPELRRFQARTLHTFGFLVPWTQHVRKARDFFFRCFDLASRTGEISYAGYACAQLNSNYLMAGDPLIEAQKQAEHGLAFARKVGFGAIEGWILGQLGLIRSLRGSTIRLGSFDDAEFLESDLERDLADKPPLALPECAYYVRKMQARFLAGEYVDVLRAASMAQPSLWKIVSRLEVVEYHFYDALCHAAVHDSASSEDREFHRARLADHIEKLDTLARHCPENFANRAALVGAEVARIEGRDADAMRQYELAIQSARDNGFVHNESLACETAARFYTARGFEGIAEMYLVKARDGYLRWGADAKVRQLEARYPHLAVAEQRGGTRAATSPDQQLDVAAVVKASQALSSEMLLPRLIERLMTIALQNAGADRGLLVLPDQHDFRIEAEARTDGEGVALQFGASQKPAVPETLIRYVMRTHERVILHDAAKPHLFAEDPYLALRRPRSILCLPLIRQGALSGLLYLENTLASDVFTPERARLLELLASQAGISLENAALYAKLQIQVGLLQQLPVSAWTLKPDGTPDFVNQVWLEFSGQTPEFVRSHPEAWMTAIHPEDREMAARSFWEGVRSGQSFAFETRALRAGDGTYRWHLQQAVVLRDSEGSILKFVGTTTDIDGQKRTEEALRRAQADLAHVARVATLNAMTASIAHEVSQPLSGIRTNASTCVRMLGANPPDLVGAAETAQRTIRDADRASGVIARLRAMFSAKPPTMETVDLNEAAREVIALSAAQLRGGRALVQTDFADDLPLVSADRVQLQQVVLNLLLNAADAMEGVEDRPRAILVKTDRRDDGSVELAVRDSGPGVDPHALAKLFEAFYTTKANGMGVGLSICRLIIESHSGRLWASPNDGPGATFSFCIPCASLTAQSRARAPASDSPGTPNS